MHLLFIFSSSQTRNVLMFGLGLKQTSFRDFELSRELSGILIFLKFRQLSKFYEATWDFTKLKTLRNKRVSIFNYL